MKKYIVAISMLVPAIVMAGPMGLSQGMTLAELQKQGPFIASAGGPSFYKSSTLAKGHPEFETYMAILTPEHGLCKLQAVGKVGASDAYGSALRSKYERLITALTEKYGKPSDKFNFLKAGSMWKESQYWMMSLYKNQRILLTSWHKSEKLRLPDSLESIQVEASAKDSDKGYVSLSYEFSNVTECLKILDTKENANL